MPKGYIKLASLAQDPLQYTVYIYTHNMDMSISGMYVFTKERITEGTGGTSLRLI